MLLDAVQPSLYTPHPTPHTLHPTPHSLHPTTHTLHPVPCTVLRTPYTVHRTPYNIHHTPYTIHHAPYTMHHTPYTIHHTPCTLHHTPYHTPYYTPLRPTRYTFPSTPDPPNTPTALPTPHIPPVHEFLFLSSSENFSRISGEPSFSSVPKPKSAAVEQGCRDLLLVLLSWINYVFWVPEPNICRASSSSSFVTLEPRFE